ncbi:hypothetical protein KJ815_08290 [bacterium]|nr:hypothetical protein [bacterium]
MVFVPPCVMVVMGKGSDPAAELHANHILADGVPVIRRGTGGCAVVLSPEMIVVSFVVLHKRQQKSAEYFRAFNRTIIRALSDQGVTHLEHAGTSDIARHGRKIAGTAIYRNRRLVFYHAVINAAGEANLMERYLKHPPRTPDYRADRTHANFVTSLAAEGFRIDLSAFQNGIETEFWRTFSSLTGQEPVTPNT